MVFANNRYCQYSDVAAGFERADVALKESIGPCTDSPDWYQNESFQSFVADKVFVFQEKTMSGRGRR